MSLLLSKAAFRMPDSPVEWQLLGNEMQLLNDISSFLNLRNREKVRVGMYVCLWERDIRWWKKEWEHSGTMWSGHPEKKWAGRRQCFPLGDHHLKAALLHLPVLNRELITDRLRSPGHRQQQQWKSWLSSTSNSLLACLFWIGCNPTGV